MNRSDISVVHSIPTSLTAHSERWREMLDGGRRQIEERFDVAATATSLATHYDEVLGH